MDENDPQPLDEGDNHHLDADEDLDDTDQVFDNHDDHDLVEDDDEITDE